MNLMNARHTAHPTSRHFSVQSFGSISAVSHMSGTGIHLDTARAPRRYSGMPTLHDSRTWCMSREAVTPCWPLPRDEKGPDVHHEIDAWAEKYGHFFVHPKANEATNPSQWRGPPAPRTQSAPEFHASFGHAKGREPKHWDWPNAHHHWEHGPPHVMLGIKPPRQSDSRIARYASYRMASTFSTGAGFAGSAPGAKLTPPYLNLKVPKGPLQRLPPPWGEAVPQHQVDGIIKRWPTAAG